MYLGPGDKLQLITTSTAPIDVLVFYSEGPTPRGVARSPSGRKETAIVTGTTSDITVVGSERVIEMISIINKHSSSSNNVTPLFNANGTAFRLFPTTTLLAGQALIWTPETNWVVPAQAALELLKILAADDTGQNVITVQPWFPTAGGVTVEGDKTYLMDGALHLSHGATSHTTGLSFTGTATLTAIDYIAKHHAVAALTIGTAMSIMRVQVATNIVICGAQTAVESLIEVKGVLRVNAGGTFIPNYTFGTDPTGTILTKHGSYFRLRKQPGDKTTVDVGAWA